MNPRSRWSLTALVGAAVVSVACGSGTSASGSASTGASQQSAQQTVGTTTKPLPPTVCDRKIVTVDDVADLLPSPISTKPLPGDPQSCVFDGGNSASITISVRPGLGDVSVTAWTNGTVPLPGVPVSGIGDRAVWQDTLREVIATKHNVLCDIGSIGAKGSAVDVQKKFAALCGKIWAAQ